MVIAPALTTRAGLRSLLGEDARFQVVGEATRPAEIETRHGDIDVLVWHPGASLDWESFLTALEQLLVAESTALLVIHDDPRLIAPLSRLKIHGWGLLPPESSQEELVAGLEAVYEGLVVTNPLWMAYYSSLPGSEAQPYPEIVEALTGRELEILQLLALGLTNKQIALKLGISTHTVKFHVSAIFAKLGTTNRSETVKRGLQKGLILL